VITSRPSTSCRLPVSGVLRRWRDPPLCRAVHRACAVACLGPGRVSVADAFAPCGAAPFGCLVAASESGYHGQSEREAMLALTRVVGRRSYFGV
jgi:hypothetical protein